MKLCWMQLIGMLFALSLHADPWEISPKKIELGIQRINSDVSTSILITNNASHEIKIDGIKTDCACTGFQISGSPIVESGDSKEIKVLVKSGRPGVIKSLLAFDIISQTNRHPFAVTISGWIMPDEGIFAYGDESVNLGIRGEEPIKNMGKFRVYGFGENLSKIRIKDNLNLLITKKLPINKDLNIRGLSYQDILIELNSAEIKSETQTLAEISIGDKLLYKIPIIWTNPKIKTVFPDVIFLGKVTRGNYVKVPLNDLSAVNLNDYVFVPNSEIDCRFTKVRDENRYELTLKFKNSSKAGFIHDRIELKSSKNSKIESIELYAYLE